MFIISLSVCALHNINLLRTSTTVIKDNFYVSTVNLLPVVALRTQEPTSLAFEACTTH